MRVLILRHAQSIGQKADAALTGRGAEQARALVPVLTGLNAGPLHASPMRRALDTIAPFAAASGREVAVADDLRERRLSAAPLEQWQEHIRRSFDDPDHAAPGGESQSVLRDRLAGALTRIEAEGGVLPCIVSHGGAISALFSAAESDFGFEDWQKLRNPDLFEAEVSGGAVTSFTRIELPFRDG